jgi:TPR repeat protein
LQGNPSAQFEMGALYERGNGVKKDYVQAAALYRKAALQGRVDAQSSLGQMYETGQGVPKDLKLALQWCQKAADAGDDSGSECVTRVGK